MPRLAISILALLLALTTSVLSYSIGTEPGSSGVPLDAARRAPACGRCHGQPPGGNDIRVHVTPSQRSLDAGQAISITTSATGGAVNPRFEGGLLTEASAGAFSAGANTRIVNNGQFLTHSNAHNNPGRAWTYGYTAPVRPGPVELHTVVNTVDGDFSMLGDTWAFHGFDPAATVGTPVRLYVNAPGARSFGTGCRGGYGNYPVLGASDAPTVGNLGFGLEVVGAATATSVGFLIGPRRQVPIDLSAFGVTGCALYVDVLEALSTTSSGGDATRGEGRTRFPVPIPNLPQLRWATAAFQSAILDPQSGRGTPVTMTNALSVTIR